MLTPASGGGHLLLWIHVVLSQVTLPGIQPVMADSVTYHSFGSGHLPCLNGEVSAYTRVRLSKKTFRLSQFDWNDVYSLLRVSPTLYVYIVRESLHLFKLFNTHFRQEWETTAMSDLISTWEQLPLKQWLRFGWRISSPWKRKVNYVALMHTKVVFD